MKKYQICILLNKLEEYHFDDLIKKYLPSEKFDIEIKEKFPENASFYHLIIPWNYHKIIKNVKNFGNVVIIHSSDLPKGRGWAPLYYTFRDDMPHYTMTCIFAHENVDQGNIILKARQLGMTSTRYAESTGLDPHNVSSARDLGILVSAASQYGLIRQFSTTPTYDFNLGYRVLKSNNTNALVRNGGWNINLSKTGYINEAGRCVVMHTTVNSRPAVVVLLGASTSQARTNDATNLLNWVATLPKRI